MEYQTKISEEVLNWLFGSDSPGVRYLALRDLLDRSENDAEVIEAQEAAHAEGPIASILDNMHSDGYWVESGPGYYPKYFGTVWSIIMLGQLGATIEVDKRIARACAYVLDQALTLQGQFSVSGTPSGTADCLQGNLCAALVSLGCEDERLEQAYEWMARSVTGEGIAPIEDKRAPIRYYAGKCGPNFACGSNNKLPCAWGAVKVMLAFSRWPEARRTPLIKRAIQQGMEFLFSVDPAKATYPTGYSEKPSRSWWKFGFPVFYVTDLLQNAEALVALGYGSDPRLANARHLIRQKQDESGRWQMEYDYTGKTWVNFGPKNKPNKWVTLRALKVLKAAA